MVGKTVLLITVKVNIESTWRLAQCSKQLTTQSIKWCYQRPSLDRRARASSFHLPSECFTSQLWTWWYRPCTWSSTGRFHISFPTVFLNAFLVSASATVQDVKIRCLCVVYETYVFSGLPFFINSKYFPRHFFLSQTYNFTFSHRVEVQLHSVLTPALDEGEGKLHFSADLPSGEKTSCTP
jgi:hypothetical protein